MRKAVSCAALTILILMSFASAVVPQNLRRQWEFNVPSTRFPRFFSSSIKYDILVNDFFARHWFAVPGAGAYSGSEHTYRRVWDSMISAWFDTSRYSSIGRDYNAQMREFLLKVEIDPDGYVYTFPPNSSHRNKLGLPFPDYTASGGLSKGWDWDDSAKGQDGWRVVGGGTTTVGLDGVWKVALTEKESYLEASNLAIDAFQSPYIIITMSVSKAGAAKLQWITDASSEWSEENSAVFRVPSAGLMADYYIPVYKHAGWRGRIAGLRLIPNLDVPSDGIDVVLDRIHCAYDTRQAVNNTSFIIASCRYYLWTGDDAFLRQNIDRIRAAAHYLRNDMGGDKDSLLTINYWGHDGTSGVSPNLRVGHGIGSDYWYVLPMGNKSAGTNIYYAEALRSMSILERAALRIGCKSNPYGESADSFDKQAAAVRKKFSETFWDDVKGRFIGCIDVDGVKHDFGFTFLNLEALYYGLGDADKAAKIFSWLDGERKIEGDTSTGSDIYRWRFAPRTSAKQNSDWYGWFWKDAKNVPYGGRVENGGAAAYVSFYDVMSRIRWKSADDGWKRFKSIMDWYADVWDAGGYRAYYIGGEKGTLQGGGKAGGLGVDAEFTETTLVPLAFLYGFLGINASADGLEIQPSLPSELEYVGVEGLSYLGAEFTITAKRGSITVKCTKNPKNRMFMLSGRKVVGTFERTVDGNYALLKLVE